VHAGKIDIKKNDRVMVIAGKDKGKSGRVIRVLPGKNQLMVEKINFIKRHTKPTQKLKHGGVIEKESPINASNVKLLCPKCDKATRIAHRILQDGKNLRYCKSCGEALN
jgi:large subunit ribosomal protein L24